MNEFETKIALSLFLAGAFLAFLFLAKPKSGSESNKKKSRKRGFFFHLFAFFFPSLYSSHVSEFGGDGKFSSSVNPKGKIPSKKNSENPKSGKPQDSIPKPKIEDKVMEIFDYNGIKILHEDGLWTVNDGGVVRVFKEWAMVPPRYQKMVKELDNRSIHDQKQEDYFLEILNGFYYVSTPGGKKKKYNRLSDIPEHIQKLLH